MTFRGYAGQIPEAFLNLRGDFFRFSLLWHTYVLMVYTTSMPRTFLRIVLNLILMKKSNQGVVVDSCEPFFALYKIDNIFFAFQSLGPIAFCFSQLVCNFVSSSWLEWKLSHILTSSKTRWNDGKCCCWRSSSECVFLWKATCCACGDSTRSFTTVSIRLTTGPLTASKTISWGPVRSLVCVRFNWTIEWRD